MIIYDILFHLGTSDKKLSWVFIYYYKHVPSDTVIYDIDNCLTLKQNS